MRTSIGKFDIGIVWAKYVNVWGQVGAVVGTINFMMLIFVFYNTSIEPSRFAIPLWLYLGVIVLGGIIGVTFVLKIGISGYYRYFSQQSEVGQANIRIKIVMDHLGINEEEMLIKMNGVDNESSR